jgi:hypothetical protein
MAVQCIPARLVLGARLRGDIVKDGFQRPGRHLKIEDGRGLAPKVLDVLWSLPLRMRADRRSRLRRLGEGRARKKEKARLPSDGRQRRCRNLQASA